MRLVVFVVPKTPRKCITALREVDDNGDCSALQLNCVYFPYCMNTQLQILRVRDMF